MRSKFVSRANGNPRCLVVRRFRFGRGWTTVTAVYSIVDVCLGPIPILGEGFQVCARRVNGHDHHSNALSLQRFPFDWLTAKSLLITQRIDRILARGAQRNRRADLSRQSRPTNQRRSRSTLAPRQRPRVDRAHHQKKADQQGQQHSDKYARTLTRLLPCSNHQAMERLRHSEDSGCRFVGALKAHGVHSQQNHQPADRSGDPTTTLRNTFSAGHGWTCRVRAVRE